MRRAFALLVAGFEIGSLGACAHEDAGRPSAVATPPPAAARPAPLASPPAIVTGGAVMQGGWLRGTAPAGTRRLEFDGAPVDFAPDGKFLVAFDRDAGPTASLSAVFGDGRVSTTTLEIASRAWEIERIDADQRPAALPSAEFQRIRAGELARIAAARAVRSGSEGWRQDFMWPAKGRISGRFGSQRIYRGVPGSYHSGIDIATRESGTRFVAPADGVVILAAASPFTLEGNLLMIDHGNGLNSAFLHCSALFVREGEAVRQGQAIGRIGATGRATGPHLHWSLKWREARLDPILFTGPMR